jgi:hypothetical protein
MIISIFFIIIASVVSFSVGFGKGYETGYFDKDEEKNNAHVDRGEIDTMEQDNPWLNSPHHPRF